jgi:hypothetical protein
MLRPIDFLLGKPFALPIFLRDRSMATQMSEGQDDIITVIRRLGLLCQNHALSFFHFLVHALLWFCGGHCQRSVVTVLARFRLLTNPGIGIRKYDGKQPGMEFLIWFEWYGSMSDRDGYRRRGHERGAVKHVEEDGGDIGSKNMCMFFVFDIRPNNVGLGAISYGLSRNTSL